MDKKREKRDIRGMRIWIFLFFTLGFVSITRALQFPELPVAFYSKSKGQFHILYGDTLYVSSIYQENWKKTKVCYPAGFEYKMIKERFWPISTNSGDYFAVDGCGWFLQLRNDSIIRIDNSFDHRNQHGTFFLSVRDTVHAVGGYGFFETTNITTYYDYDTKGWFIRDYNGTENLPNFEGHIIVEEGDELYVLGGSIHDAYGAKILNEVWTINTRTWVTSYKGVWNSSAELRPSIQPLGRHNDGRWIHVGRNFFQLFPGRNEVRKFVSEKFKSVSDFIVHDGQFLMFNIQHNQKIVDTHIYNQDNWVGKYYVSDSLYTPDRKHYTQWQSFIIPSLLLIFAIGYWWQRKQERRKEAHDVINEEVRDLRSDLEKEKLQEEEIMDNQGVEAVWALTELEQSLLEFLILKRVEGVEMNELNPFFDYGQPNFDTLKKRRELKLRELKVKLAGIYKLTLEEVWTERRLESDRRIKRLYLHPAIEIEKSESN